MSLKKIEIVVGEKAEFELELRFADGSPMDLSGLAGSDLTLYAKRYQWQANDEAFVRLELGAGLAITNPTGTEQDPATIKATFENTTAYKVGDWVFSLWRSDLQTPTPIGFGLFTVVRR